MDFSNVEGTALNPTGRLELTWTNKHLRLLSHGSDTYEWVEPTDWRVTEVRPLRHVETVGEAGSGNLLIEGDASHLLDALLKVPELAAQYRGKVKLCYIDPPFNTGQAFEHYNDAVEHSVWLTMLRDRFMQIRDLLSPDGSVWVHLDDKEQHRARDVLDEVFGATNFVATIVWEKDVGRRNDTDVSSVHDYIHLYAKTKNVWKHVRNLLERTAAQEERYRNPDEDVRGPWLQGDNGTAKSGSDKARFPITLPSGRIVRPPAGNFWRFSEEALSTARTEERVWFGQDGDSLPVIKRYITAVQQGVVPRTWWPGKEVGTNQDAKRDHLRPMFPDLPPFSTPKPEPLMQRIIEIGTNPGDIVLDCYAGSGTTAAVAHKMGRRWVTSEVRADTLAAFTKPRLTKVVRDEDPGGITSTTTVEFVGDLPDGPAPADVNRAANFLKGLREHGIFDELPKPKRNQQGGPLAQVVALLKEHPEVQDVLLETMAKQMRVAAKTKKVETTLWSGGGGFDVAKVAPSMFVEDDGHLFLAEWAIGGALAEAVAAQVGYTVDMDGPFAGRKGRARLAVLDGMLTGGVADFLVEQLGARETVLVIAQTLEPGVDEHLRKARAGSRARKVPRDLARRSVLSGLKVQVRSASKDVAGAQASDANDGNL